MKLEDMLLIVEGIKITVNGKGGYYCELRVPVHPKLVEDKTLTFDRELPFKLIDNVAKEWHVELKEYLNKPLEESDRNLIEHVLAEEFEIEHDNTHEYGRVSITTGNIEAEYHLDKRGFAETLIARDGAGSIAVMALVRDSLFELNHIHKGYVDFNEEQMKEYTATQLLKKPPHNFKVETMGYAYSPHNMDDIPAALFLRRWAVAYHNECLKQVFDKK